MKLKLKFILFIVFYSLVMILFVSTGMYIVEKQFLTEELNTMLVSIIDTTNSVVKDSFLSEDDTSLITYINTIKDKNDIVEYAFVKNVNGIVLAHTDPQYIKTSEGEMLVKTKKEKLVNGKKFIIGNLISGLEITELSNKVSLGKREISTVKIGFSNKKIKDKISLTMKKFTVHVIRIAIILIILSIIASILFATFILNPIKHIVNGVRDIAQGKLHSRINLNRKDELGFLAEEIDIMAYKLEELDQLKDDFVNSVSHELRSPLAAIEGYADLLLEESLSEQQKEYCDVIKQSCNRLGGFINNILDIAKIESGQFDLIKSPCEVKRLILDIITLFTPVAEKKKIRITSTLPQDVVVAILDQERIREVITNLLSNALKFTPENGTINIKLEDGNKELKFFVKDTGCGIPKDDLKYIFDKFHQVREHRKKIKGPKGSGLGLTIVKNIINLHKGSIEVKSVVGQGTEFIVTLPKE